jgi:GT2 family glycosyltransferase
MRIAVQVIAYLSTAQAQSDLAACLASLLAVNYPREAWCLVLIDNPGALGPARAWLREWMRAHADTLPEVFLVEEGENTGFAGGHAHGYERARAWGADAVFLLNQDARVAPDALSLLAGALEQDASCGAVQAGIYESGAVKASCGNALTYTGFGYADTVGALPHFYASGAATLYRVAALEDAGGLFDARYFLYHEDTDVSWRLRLRGWSIASCPAARVEHRYEFGRSKSKFYWIERNRWVLLLTHYTWGTLLRAAPMLIVGELGAFVFSFLHGWGRQKFAALWSLTSRNTRAFLREHRRAVQALRTVPDAALLPFFASTIEAQPTDHFLVRYALNPLLAWWGRYVMGVKRPTREKQ